jgi:hypothetical protein
MYEKPELNRNRSERAKRRIVMRKAKSANVSGRRSEGGAEGGAENEIDVLR